MTLAEFIALPADQHQPLTQTWGVYLGCCRRPTGAVLLYYYPAPDDGFYVELHYPPASLDNVRAYAFTTALPLRTELTLWQPSTLQ